MRKVAINDKKKAIWFTEKEILKKFDFFCETYDLRYFIDYGTLLGAVRHQGFIPWDDDIDISMLRSDYEKMQHLAMKEFAGDIFFQSTYTDSQVMQVTKIRDRRTTAIEYPELDGSFCQGIFIDIFPMDDAVDGVHFTDQMKEIERECLLSAVNPRFLLEQIENGYQTVMPFDMLSEMMRSGPRAAFRQFELFALDHAGTSENIGWISNELRGGSARRKREWYTDVVYLPFEGMMVPAPIGYEEVLKVQYGPDWRTPVKGASGHEKIFYDPDRPYSYYLNDEHRHEIDLDQVL